MAALRIAPRMLAIYRRTYFQVRNPRGRLSRFTVATLHKHTGLSRKKFAVITAWNPMNQTLSQKENKALNRKLALCLKKSGYVFYPTDGWLGCHLEQGFTVEGIGVREVKQLGRLFHQYAIFYNDRRGPRFLRCCPGPLRGGSKTAGKLSTGKKSKGAGGK